MPRFLRVLSLTSLVLLLGIELFTNYDTGPRQLALALTNAAAMAAIIALSRAFDTKSASLYGLLAVAIALGVWFDAMGNFVHFYARILWWDRVAHAFGTAAVTVAAASLLVRLQQWGKIRLTPGFHVLFAVSLGALAAMLYEISELIGDELFDLHRVTDLFDTADDLQWNLLAAIPAALIVVWFARRKKLLTG
jgi:hypothetical protein